VIELSLASFYRFNSVRGFKAAVDIIRRPIGHALPALAAELVRLKVQVIVALSTLAAVLAEKATTAVPIVTVSSDPIGTELIAGLARPGANISGLSFFSPDLVGKRLELLEEVVPRLSRLAILWDVEGPPATSEVSPSHLR
jgi:putative ABC transport system substrate-binding protein